MSRSSDDEPGSPAARLLWQVYSEIWDTVQAAALRGNVAAERLSRVCTTLVDNDRDRISALMQVRRRSVIY
jgi:hypothetical protein